MVTGIGFSSRLSIAHQAMHNGACLVGDGEGWVGQGELGCGKGVSQ